MPQVMGAGHETTATTTAAALYCISAHPAVEQQLIAELRSVLGDRAPTYADLEQLTYLQVCPLTCRCADLALLRWQPLQRAGLLGCCS